ncbi:hypothetical protein Ciccas_003687 [Cichlidogyrus casuarinus]|uniref:Uncharacterized protein n=1 Tax=Cichlidogyrus casuarinus TaxID=1844966 RepID=A0ABD2QFW5_9PLAT
MSRLFFLTLFLLVAARETAANGCSSISYCPGNQCQCNFVTSVCLCRMCWLCTACPGDSNWKCNFSSEASNCCSKTSGTCPAVPSMCNFSQ